MKAILFRHTPQGNPVIIHMGIEVSHENIEKTRQHQEITRGYFVLLLTACNVDAENNSLHINLN